MITKPPLEDSNYWTNDANNFASGDVSQNAHSLSGASYPNKVIFNSKKVSNNINYFDSSLDLSSDNLNSSTLNILPAKLKSENFNQETKLYHNRIRRQTQTTFQKGRKVEIKSEMV